MGYSVILPTLNEAGHIIKLIENYKNKFSIAILRDNGLEVVDNIVEDVSVIKNQYQIPNNLRSCHSAQIANYKIEGHVPIESINKLFIEKPNIIKAKKIIKRNGKK